MLRLSTKTGHAVKALCFLNHRRACLIPEIAGIMKISTDTLRQILGRLQDGNLVVCKTGYKGGVLLARPSTEITLLEIVEAMEGDDWVRRCAVGMRECDPSNPCSAHDTWMKVKRPVRDSLSGITLSQMRHLLQHQPWARGLPLPAQRPVEAPSALRDQSGGMASEPWVPAPRETAPLELTAPTKPASI